MVFKRLAINYLPGPFLRTAKRLHYRSSLKHYDLNAEPDLLGCKRLIAPGNTVVDVGANIGVYTRFCSEFVGPGGKVIAMEPVPETFSYLRSNVRALGLENVKCVNFAASDHDSNLDTMVIPQYPTGGANLYEAELSAEGNVHVKSAQLDTLFPSISPQLIKCDVEGHEAACVKGALNLIRRCRPKWLMEVSRKDIFELFRSLDYAAFYFKDGGFREYRSTYVGPNLFFFPR